MHRASDDGGDHAPTAERQVFTFDRRIPATWLFGCLGALAVCLVTMFFQGRATAEKVVDMAADIKTIKDSQQSQALKAAEDSYSVRDLMRRVTVIEATIQASQQASIQQKARP